MRRVTRMARRLAFCQDPFEPMHGLCGSAEAMGSNPFEVSKKIFPG